MKTTGRVSNSFIIAVFFSCLLFSCSRAAEVSLDEWEGISVAGLEELLAQTQFKPWRGRILFRAG